MEPTPNWWLEAANRTEYPLLGLLWGEGKLIHDVRNVRKKTVM